MDSLRSWVVDPQWAQSAWLGLVVKSTLVLGFAWLCYHALGRANPRWRRLVWRTTAVGCALVAIASACPPLVSWAILQAQPEQSGAVVAQAEPVAAQPAVQADRNPRGTSPAFPPTRIEFGRSRQLPDAGRAVTHVDRERTSDRDYAAKAGMASKAVPVMEAPQPAESATSPMVSYLTDLPWRWILIAIWSSGVALLLVQTLLGVRWLARIRSRAAAAPAWMVAEAEAMAKLLDCRRHPQLLVSDEITSPCILGVVRPAVLLPSPEQMPLQASELRAILAHELAHLRGHDVAWQLAIHTVATLWWFHPFAWRMRAAHALACDEVSDCVAAHHLGDAAAYGRTLARLALRSMPRAATGMAMAQGSSVRQRIENLQRRLFPAALGRGRVACAVAASLALFVLVGGLAIAQAEPKQEPAKIASAKPAAEKPAAEKAKETEPKETKSEAAKTDAPKGEQAKRSVKVHVASDQDEPVGGAKIRFFGRLDGKRYDRYLKTDAEGRATLELPPGKKVDRMTVKCDKPGMVSVYYLWDGQATAVELPAELELRMAKGVAVSGLVNDEQGQPIAGATIDVHMPITWPRLANHVFTIVEVKSDKDGRWQSPSMPADLSQVSVGVTHPDYIRAYGKFSGRENVAVMTQGLQLAGRVIDGEGQPVAKARVALGTDRFGTNQPESQTDKDGRFVLKNCKVGRSIVTVQAGGFSPQFKDVIVGTTNEELDFALTPGHTVRVRVVDPRGNPIEGAYFCTDTWRGYRSLDLRVQTNAEGRVQWSGAPNDTVLCDLFKSGHMSNRKVAVKAGDEELTITLPDELAISGSVTDAVTGKPIPAFGVRSGLLFENSDRVYLSNDEPTKYTDGAYSFKFHEPYRGLLLEFSAEGYKPLQSRHFLPTDGKQTLDVKLTPSAGMSGLVLLPNGEPAAGAEVGYSTADTKAYLANGHYHRSANPAPVYKTDASGKFTMPERDDKSFLLVVVHDAGYAEVREDEFAKSKEIRLTPWGRLEGRVMVGDKPDVNREVSFYSKSGEDNRNFVFANNYTTQTDAEGRYAFDRVIPGPGTVSRVVVTQFGSSSSHAPCWQVPVDVPAAGTVTANIGGTGRPVVGRVKLDRQPDVLLDWTTNDPAMITLQEDGVKNKTYLRCGANIDREGRFAIPDVPPGEYVLAISVNNPPRPNACGGGEVIGRGKLSFVVPKMKTERSDEPLDLGTITATLLDTLDSGEIAPDFVLEGLTGSDVRLSDFRGKLVLLDFWATWCAPCLAEMPSLKEIQEAFGEDSRFAMIGLACDQQIDVPRECVKKNALPWTNAHAGASGSGIGGIAAKYTVRALPATFLIGPDGRVLAKNLRGADLKKAVAAALADEELFKSAAVSAPPARFPVVRFQADSAEGSTQVTPAVLVMDDSDPNWEQDRPHDDALRAFADDGAELWALKEFNTSQTVSGGDKIAIDRARQRIYVIELSGDRLTAIDFSGQKHWHAEQVEGQTIAVDAKTGNIWVSGGPMLNQGETVVFDPAGNEVTAFPYVGIDMVADDERGVFWLTGYEILQVDRTGKIRFRLPVSAEGGWCCASVALDPTDGSAWFGERQHPDVADSKNRLWHVDAQGQILQKLELDDFIPFRLARDPASGELWISGYPRKIKRLGADGQFKEPLAIEVANIAFGRAGGAAWVTTETKLLKLDDTGKPIWERAFEKPSQQNWLTAF